MTKVTIPTIKLNLAATNLDYRKKCAFITLFVTS